MPPFDAVLTFFERFFDFRGRASRSEFWWCALFLAAVGIAAGVTDKVLIERGAPPMAVGVMGLLLAIPNASLTVRRLHDVGRSGLWTLVPGIALTVTAWLSWHSLAPGFRFPAPTGDTWVILSLGVILTLVSQAVILIWLALRGNEGPNRFGHGLMSPHR